MKNTFNLRAFILFSIILCNISFAQKKLNLTVKYDNEFDRYEVYAKPNFSQRNFTWGPSQISIVIPTTVLVDKIQIRNVDGGAWEDNSIIQAPETSPDFSYHGISTSGDKTDLVENNESILFYFSLPKGVNPNMVRIFDNKKDPNSSSKGMLGGDFQNSIVDMTGNELFAEVYKTEKEKVSHEELITNFDATVYPNVLADEKFYVSLNGISEKDGDILMVLSDETGREILRHRGSKTVLEKQAFQVKDSHRTLILKFITSKGSVSKRLIADN